MSKNRLFTTLLYIAMLVTNVVGPLHGITTAQGQAAADRRADAVVLVNSTSPGYPDFQHFIQPYLDHFGVPYTVLDAATTAVSADINTYALILIGHKQLDTTHAVLDSTEEGYISAAVSEGTGLVNFDNDLSNQGASRYSFINSVFGFVYNTRPSLSSITFSSESHYITENHAANDVISTANMTLAGLTLPGSVTALATAGSGSEPFLAVTTNGQGRAVQWGTYDWMSHAVKGPVYDLDDLVWRSLVWAARKPFVMQGMPRFVTFRMDDVNGPLDWIHIANEYGFIPWSGVFPDEIDAAEAADMSGLANSGKGTFAPHAFSTSDFIYFNHAQSKNFTDAQAADNTTRAAQWFQNNAIPISKYVVGHYYELGSNVFDKLQSWGVQFVGTMMDPGKAEADAQWVQNGPFRLYETGSARDLSRPVYNADYLNIPNHPELANKFFNCITEFRDIDGYEWHAYSNIDYSILTGERWLSRAFNNMDLATLFTHEYDLEDIDMTMWRQIMQGISQGIAEYQPIYVPLDYACQYVRATHNSNITTATYSTSTNQLITSFGGETDMVTKFYVFSDSAGQIAQQMVDVPVFAGTTQVTFSPPGQLHHITVSPNPATVVAGGTQQFSAVGYDVDNNPIPNLALTWQVINGGGAINASGLFTAGATTGSYADTVAASYSGIQGSASVQVIETSIHHFSFDPITSPIYASIAFPVTLRAQDANGYPVIGYNGQVTLTDTTGTVQPAQASGFTNGIWTGSLTISQIAAGVTITAIDGSITGTSSTFNIVQTKDCPCSIWDNSTTPQITNVTDNRPIEVGFKFNTSIDGYITGLRFYKGTLNTGAHTGHLWTADGTLLATAAFTGETNSGWQQTSLSNPVSIVANTTYIASYYSQGGYFAETSEGFATAVLNAPLKALANGEEGPNGVYRYDSAGFPSTAWTGHSPNYWVDVVFETNIGADTTPPVVLSTTPHSGDTSTSINSNVSVVFNEAINANTVSASTFELHDPANALIPSDITYSSVARTATLDPSSPLVHSTTYTVVVKGGQSGIQDLAGNPLAADVTWTFSTESPPPPPPSEGPGGPILIISTANNPFSRYFTEILRAEGLNAFIAKDITQVTAADLLNYDVVLLGEMPLTADQASMLGDWVNNGGNLIAMRPDASLNNLMGLSAPSGTLTDGYLLVDTSHAPGYGIVNQTIQYHGTADLRTLNGAASIAALYQNSSTPANSPAVSINNVGTNGGQAAAFAYDLARSIVYTRQGNPGWAGQERDGNSLIRSDDMFFGNAVFDPQPDWVNHNKIAIPQADEQQRLLANLILMMEQDRKPLPRFWYLPHGAKAAVLMTGDDHSGGGTAGRFDYYLAQSPTGCSLDDWQCIRATAYIYSNNPMSNASAASYQAQGFEIALHVNTNCANFTPETLADFYSTQLASLQAKYTSLSASKSVRTHCIAWSDWDSQVTVKLSHNIRMDLDYYFWPPEWVQNQPGLFTGSAMPMRFADINGGILDVYQVVTQMTDESGQSYPFTIDTLLDRAIGYTGYYGIFTANMHHDSVDSAGATAIINSAKSRGIPVVSAEQVRRWLDGRNNSSFQNLNWNANTLSFHVAFGAGSNGLQVLLPSQSRQGALTSISLNGSPVTYALQTIKGIQYATFLANAGTYQAVYGIDSTAPVISSVSAQPSIDGTAAITWTTDELADARVDYGTNPDALDINSIDTGMGLAHNTVLSNLALNTTYYYRITPKDSFGNSTTWPASSSAPASFKMPTVQYADTTTANFQAGTPGTGIYIAQMEDGEVILSPADGEEFSGTSLPDTWNGSAWDTGGTVTVSNNQLVVDGARASTNDYYSAGRALEFTATFGASVYQHIGFGQTLAYFSESWAMFSTWNTNNTLYARINNAGNTKDVVIPGSWLGAPHRYRIEWNASNIVFLIDGVVVHTEPTAITATLRPLASDAATGGLSLKVDWLQLSPYATSGIFNSRVFDAGSTASWSNINWASGLPDNTGLVMRARAGNTPTPDASWTPFSQLTTSGESISGNGQYFQYQAELSTTNTNQTPVLKNVSFEYAAVAGALPQANADAYTVAEDAQLNISAPGVLTNDSSPDNGPLTAALVTGPANGTLTLNANGSFDYSPNANFNGTDTFSYKAVEGSLESSAASVTLTVTPVNDPTTAANDSYTINEDQTLTITAPGVLSNDADIDGDTLTVSSSTQPTHGTLTLNANGSFMYTPEVNFYGSDSFTYTNSDGQGSSASAAVNITIASVNDSPTAVNDSVTTAEDSSITFAVLTNDTDAEGDALTITSYTQPAHGTLILNPAGTFTDTPAANYNGTDSFTYTISDGKGGTATGTVTITLTPVNDPPIAVNDSAYTTAEDTTLTIAAPGVLTNDSDPDGDTLTVSASTQPLHGVRTFSANGSLTYTPAANYNGSDSFTYTISDGHGSTANAVVTIIITAVNDAPTVTNDATSTSEDTAVTFSVLTNDTDIEGTTLTVGSFTQPARGTLVKNANNSFTYTPNANINGTDSFTYRASDGSLTSTAATVTITIAAVIDTPLAAADAYNTMMNQALTITAPGVLANDTNLDGGALTAVLATAPAQGTVTLNTNGSFTYTPVTGYIGSDSFTYQSSNGTLNSTPAAVTIQVIDPAIFSNGFESGNLSAWSSRVIDLGDLSVTSNAALGGTMYGMQAVIDDRNAIYVVDNTPAAETRYTAQFSFDPNSTVMVSGNANIIFAAKNSSGANMTFVELRYYLGSYQIRTGLINDRTATTTSSWFTITDAPHVIEIAWKAATAAGANNGSLTLRIDGTQRANLTGIDNDTRRIEQAVLGAVGGLDNGTRGTYYFDEFSSHR